MVAVLFSALHQALGVLKKQAMVQVGKWTLFYIEKGRDCSIWNLDCSKLLWNHAFSFVRFSPARRETEGWKHKSRAAFGYKDMHFN